MHKFLDNLEKYLLFLTVFLVPLTVLPIFPNPFGVAKTLVLVGGVCLTLLVKAIKTIVNGKLEISLGSFDFPLLLLLAAYLISGIVRTPNRMEAFFIPGNVSIIVASVFVYFLLNSLKDQKQELKVFLVTSGVIYAAALMLSASGTFSKILQLPEYIRAASFNFEGSLLSSAIILAVIFLVTLNLLLKQKSSLAKAFVSLCLVIVLIGLGLSAKNSLPGSVNETKLLPTNISWSVFVDTIKQSPLLGTGPGNYVTAFNLFRPVTYNSTDLWQSKFFSARSAYLTMATETGLVGLLALILLLIAIYKLVAKTISSKDRTKIIDISALAFLTVLLFFFPASTSVTVLFLTLLALGSQPHPISLNLTINGTNQSLSARLPAILIGLPIIAGVVILSFYSIKYLKAEIKFKQALEALVKNDGKTSYDTLKEAITLNPKVDRYQASYSKVNLALARSIAQKPKLSEKDKTTVTQLVQQAIRSGKATVLLNPQRSGNWQLLAETYRSIIPLAKGADTFAVQTYNQAVLLDPVNPDLRIALGGIYYALGMYDNAISAFELAVLAKPDNANGHYNLAIAYREKGEIEKAKQQMTLVLSMVNKDSTDYDLAKKDLEAIEKRLPVKQAAASDNLNPPTKAEQQLIKPPLELPQDATPPVSPSPIPVTE